MSIMNGPEFLDDYRQWTLTKVVGDYLK